MCILIGKFSPATLFFFKVSYLRSLGLHADYIHKECDKESIKAGKTTYVYTSPEAVLSDDMRRSMLIESSSFKLFVVDEAHLVINWYV